MIKSRKNGAFNKGGMFKHCHNTLIKCDSDLNHTLSYVHPTLPNFVYKD